MCVCPSHIRTGLDVLWETWTSASGNKTSFLEKFVFILLEYSCFTVFVLVSALQQNESAIYVQASLIFSSFLFWSPLRTE